MAIFLRYIRGVGHNGLQSRQHARARYFSLGFSVLSCVRINRLNPQQTTQRRWQKPSNRHLILSLGGSHTGQPNGSPFYKRTIWYEYITSNLICKKNWGNMTGITWATRPGSPLLLKVDITRLLRKKPCRLVENAVGHGANGGYLVGCVTDAHRDDLSVKLLAGVNECPQNRSGWRSWNKGGRINGRER